MQKRFIITWTVTGVIAWAALACTSTSGGAATAMAPSPAASATSSGPEAFPSPSPLNQAAAQLDDLPSYRAALRLTASGTQGDHAFQWTYALTQTVSRESALTAAMVDTEGLGVGQDYVGTVLIQSGERFFARWSVNGPCVEEQPELAQGLFDAPAALLPNLADAKKDKSGEMTGLAAEHYSLAAGESGVTGELWAAKDGGFLIRASLKQDGLLTSLGTDVKGHAEWDYDLESVNQPVAPDLPLSCRHLLGDLPIPTDAVDVSATDDGVQYTTASSQADLAAFYSDTMNKGGWESLEQPATSEDAAWLAFRRKADRVFVSAVRVGSAADVTILIETGEAGSAGPEPTPANASNPSERVSGSLNLTLGLGASGAVLPSFHLEVNGSDPAWSTAKANVQVTGYTMSADVQGKDVYLQYSSTKDGKPDESLEGYIVGDKEYTLIGGKPTESPGSVKLTWALWPLNPVLALGVASTGATPQGEESIAGRAAEKYALDTSNAPPGALAALGGISDIKSVHGTAWIDQETGALLKAVLDYEAEYTDQASGKVLGQGSGHVEIEVSQVGSVTVRLP